MEEILASLIVDCLCGDGHSLKLLRKHAPNSIDSGDTVTIAQEILASNISASTRNNHLRIKELEDALRTTNDELASVMDNYNSKLKSEITSHTETEPDYMDYQTCYDNAKLLDGK